MSARALRRLPELSAVAKSGVRWWLSELAGLIPGRLRTLASRRKRWLLVDVLDKEVVIGRLGAGYGELARGSLPTGEAPIALTRPIQPFSKDAIVAVRVPHDEAMHRIIDLPIVPERQLRSVLTHELERRTPFLAEQVFFDYRVIDRDRAARRSKVEIALVPRPIIDRAINLSRRCGLPPSVIGLKIANAAAPKWNFLQSADSTTRDYPHRLTSVLVGLCILLSVSFAASWVQEQNAALKQLQNDVVIAKRDAPSDDSLTKEIDRLEERSRLLAGKRAAPRLIEVLDELTRILPQDTWVFEFQLGGADGHITGYSAGASKLIGLLDGSRLFENAHFQAPLTQGPNAGLERFDLGFTVKGTSS